MDASLAILALLLQAAAPAPPVRHADLGPPLAGRDFLLIRTAARHRAMRGRDLGCYRIHIYDDEDGRRVAFVARRRPTTERETRNGRQILFHGQDPDCRTISFVMDAEGRVARVIHSRH